MQVYTKDPTVVTPIIGYSQNFFTGAISPVYGPPQTITGLRLVDGRASYGIGLETFALGFPDPLRLGVADALQQGLGRLRISYNAIVDGESSGSHWLRKPKFSGLDRLRLLNADVAVSGSNAHSFATPNSALGFVELRETLELQRRGSPVKCGCGSVVKLLADYTGTSAAPGFVEELEAAPAASSALRSPSCAPTNPPAPPAIPPGRLSCQPGSAARP